MDHLERPSNNDWAVRRTWFEARFDVDARGGGYIMGEHATALLIDLQAVYCAGAFVSVVILACTIIDAHLREVEGAEYRGGIQAAFADLTSVQGLEWLRQRRNRLVHYKPLTTPTITVDHQWCERGVHEADAQRAILLVSDVLFEHPWT